MRTLVFGGCNFVCRMKGALYRDPSPLELVMTVGEVNSSLCAVVIPAFDWSSEARADCALVAAASRLALG